VPGSAPVAFAATMKSCPTRCSRLSLASCCCAVDSASRVGAAEGARESWGSVEVPEVDLPGTGVLVGEEVVADGVTGAVVGLAVSFPLEQPGTVVTRIPAAAALTPRDAIDWILRMVNREFVGVGFPLRDYPGKSQCPSLLRADGRGTALSLTQATADLGDRGGCSLRSSRECVNDSVHGSVVMRRGQEPCFED